MTLLAAASIFGIQRLLEIPKINPQQSSTENQSSQTKETKSALPTRVIVPNVVGSSREQAKTILEQAGLQLGDIRSASFRAEDVGKIVKQKPKALQEVDRNTPIDLTIGE